MTPKDRKRDVKSRYRNTRELLLSDLDQISNEDDCDIHRAFVRRSAEIFSSTASGFSLTDGPNDHGIDFSRDDSPVFTIAQCKIPESDTLFATDKPVTFDRDALEDIRTGMDFMLDKEGTYPDIRLDLKRFKRAYHESLQEWPKETRLEAGLCIFGKLSGPAANLYRNERNKRRKDGVELVLWDWERFNELLSTPTVDVDKIRLTLTVDDFDKEALSTDKCLICFAHAFELVKAWEEYSWTLLDWNVRAEIQNSQVNPRIQHTLVNPTTRRQFHHLNNGMLIVCRQRAIADPRKAGKGRPGQTKVVLHGAQIVNGCQTMLSLYRAYISLSEKDADHFRENVRVVVKVISDRQKKFVDRIVRTTNEQNPMSPRSLRANNSEQRQLEQSFSKFFVPWFYERKDGQYAGYVDFPKRVPGFREAQYRIQPKKKAARVISNKDLAREWLAFIGMSDRTLRGGLKIFESDELYTTVFLSTPTREYWSAIQESPADTPAVEELLDSATPSVSQYLLAHIVRTIIQKRRISLPKNREAGIQRLVKHKKIKTDPSGRPLADTGKIDDLLKNDDEYWQHRFMYNAQDVLIELMAMLLCARYGPLEAELCDRILRHPPIRMHVENPNLEVPAEASRLETKHTLNLCYEFCLFAVGQYVIRYGAESRNAPRLKSYLAKRDTVDKLREFLMVANEEKVPNWVAQWCPEKLPFLEQLPDIP